jgi:hypothetical protein
MASQKAFTALSEEHVIFILIVPFLCGFVVALKTLLAMLTSCSHSGPTSH